MTTTTVWCLEGYVAQGSKLVRFPIAPLPFQVGRSRSCDLPLRYPMISSQHAELALQGDGLVIRDMGSTNGTFVNRNRISGEETIREGDVVHFANLEFRVVCEEYEDTSSQDSGAVATMMGLSELPHRLPTGLREFRSMLQMESVTTKFQPIVQVRDRKLVGYEILGRGDHPGLPDSPMALFEIAAVEDLEPELSRLFRRKGIELAHRLPGGPKMYMNTAPAESGKPELLDSLKELRAQNPKMPLVLEIHEGAVTDPGDMRELRGELTQLDIGLAYDDFGAGQARLVELVEVQPDVLKFDIRMIRNIHLAPETKQQMLGTLVKMVSDLGISALAEGVETEEEADKCLELGFELAQGYLYGKPSDPPPEVTARTIDM